MSETIRFEDVSKSYDGQRKAVDGVDLEIPAGSFTTLLGTSGCGKTTTLKMINRLIEPTSGRITVGAQDVRNMDAIALRRSIGYVIQAVGLFPHLRIEKNIAVVPELLGWDAARIDARVDELLELVRLNPKLYRKRMPAELSGGQRQRVGFARALAAHPHIMLLDEPFGALDPITRDNLQTELRELQKQLGFTAVMVTHDMTEALLMSDQIVVMKDGRVVQVGAPVDLMNRPANAFVEEMMSTPLKQAQVVHEIRASKTD